MRNETTGDLVDERSPMRRILTGDDWKKCSPEELRRFQDEKFKWHVRTMLAECSPYFSTLFADRGIDPSSITGIGSWQNLKLPLIRKDTFRAQTEAFRLAAPGGWEKSVLAYRSFLEKMGPLPVSVTIDRFAKLTVEHPVHALFATASPEVDERTYSTFFEPSGVFFSGGSTGVPVSVEHTRLDRELFEIATKRLHSELVRPIHEAGRKVVAATLYPQAPHMGFWMTTWGLGAAAHLYVGLSGAGILPTERLAELSVFQGVNALAGIPSYFRNRFVPAWIEAARTLKTPLPQHIVISLGGEPVTDGCRADIQSMLVEAGAGTVNVVGGYGASESRFNLWYECGEGHGYHSAASDMVATRIVRTSDGVNWEFVDDGEEGYLVIFPLDGFGTVLTGFLLGDTAVMTHERCPGCGYCGPRILRIGRVSDVSTQLAIMGTVEKKIRGATVNLEDLREQLLKHPEVSEVQLVIRHRVADDRNSPDELVVRFATRSEASRHEALDSEIGQLTKHISEIMPVTEIVSIEDLLGRTLKFQPIIDRRIS